MAGQSEGVDKIEIKLKETAQAPLQVKQDMSLPTKCRDLGDRQAATGETVDR